MGLKIIQVDAFTDTPFTGNPAAVCILSVAQDEHWMQNVAREMNLSETAYQASARGGIVRVRVDGNRVYLSGQAITVMHGDLV